MGRQPRVVDDLDEAALVHRIQRGCHPRGRAHAAHVTIGIGDDAAVLDLSGDESLVVSADLAVEGVDFEFGSFPADAVGHRALAQNLSDLAAMGARPLGFTLSLGCHPGMPLARLDRLVDGMGRCARAFGCPLLGGDLSAAPSVLLAITVLGATPRGSALTRSGARPGEVIWVTGCLGGASMALAYLRTRRRVVAVSAGALVRSCARSMRGALQRYLLPEPRVVLGQRLRAVVSACIDVSDGLARDLDRLCRSSRVGAELDAGALPLAPGADLETALGSGEEFELLFTAPLRETGDVQRAAAEARVAAWPIGQIVRRRGVRVDGVAVDPLGFEHFGPNHTGSEKEV